MKKKNNKKDEKGVAGGPGFEPRLPGPEPGVLPLNYPPLKTYSPYLIARFHNKEKSFFDSPDLRLSGSLWVDIFFLALPACL